MSETRRKEEKARKSKEKRDMPCRRLILTRLSKEKKTEKRFSYNRIRLQLILILEKKTVISAMLVKKLYVGLMLNFSCVIRGHNDKKKQERLRA